jgi:predicted lipoprotein with Yx(FWY)xxD motif
MVRSKSYSYSQKALWLVSILMLGVLVLSACVQAATPAPTEAPAPTAAPTEPPAPTNTPAPTPTPAPTAVPEITLGMATDAKLGKILVGDNNMTLYMFTKDEADKSNCNADCLSKWPPLITQGSPKLGDGVDAKLVGNTKLADGRMIVTYNKMPLYYWVKDTKAGDTTGQGVGEVWYVVSTAGKAVGMEPTIKIAEDAKLGKILVGDGGMTLYMFTKDEAGKTNCNADCLAKWPPLVTAGGKPKLGDGVDAAMIGTADLADGSKIVTYNKMPLYYWVKDTKAGDTTGQGVGSVWYVVAPNGKAVGYEPPQAEPTISVVTDPKLGKILVGDKGMTLYMYTKDGPDTINCAGDCLVSWPPLFTSGKPNLGPGVDPKLVGTAKLPDGKLVVTYNKMPLYYWIKDVKAGDVTGQGVGKVWYVVSPAGKAVGRPAASAATGSYGP